MTENALLEALREARRPKTGGQGLRVEEICAKLNVGPVKARDLIRAGLATGAVKRTDRYIECLDGRMRRVPGYALVKPR